MAQNNGNNHINTSRESINSKTDKKKFLGNSKKRQWENKRRNRSI